MCVAVTGGIHLQMVEHYMFMPIQLRKKTVQNKRNRHRKDNKWRRNRWKNSVWKWCVGYWPWRWLYSTKLSHKYPTLFTFVVWELPDDPGWLVSVQVNIQNVTKSLWVQITPCSDHSCRRQATLPPGNMGHDVHWNGTKKEHRVGDASKCQGAECSVGFLQHRPGCEAMIITASGLRCARFGMSPLYKSTLVWTTLTYDCSLLHALAVTTMTLEPAEADKSNKEESSVVRFWRSQLKPDVFNVTPLTGQRSGPAATWQLSGVQSTHASQGWVIRNRLPEHNASQHTFRKWSDNSDSARRHFTRLCDSAESDVPRNTSTLGRLKISRSVLPPLVELSGTSMKTSLSTLHWMKIRKVK